MMKVFIRNILLFFLPLIVVGIISEVLIREIPKNYSEKKMYLDKNADSLQVLFLGSSHALFAINPEWIQKKSFNAAFVSQTYDLDFELVKKYDSQWKHLEYIVLPISYFSLFEILSKGKEHWRIKNYVIYMNMDVSKKIEDHSEMLGNKLYFNLFRIYSNYVLGQNEINCSRLGWQKRDFSNPQKIEADGPHRAQLHTIMKHGIDTESILQSIIDYAQDRNIRVILYTPPAYSSYVEHLDTQQLNRTLSVAQAMDTAYPHVFYYNFLNDKSFSIHDFYDSDHLNCHGSQKMTAKMDSILHYLDTK